MTAHNDTIELVPYNAEWPQIAAIEIQKLREVLPSNYIIDIQHVGSTAVPRMSAKPIIDIQIAVDSLQSIKQYAIDALKIVGYEYWYENPDPERMFFVKGKPPLGEKRTHHVHIVELGSKHWQEKILFRDYLIDHHESASEYEQLKVTLAKENKHDREKYTDAKTKFIAAVLSKAKATFHISEQYPVIIFITGASGAGKTTIVDALKNKYPISSVSFLHFDDIGVPSEKEMNAKYGSGSEWQKAMTYHWVKKLLTDYQTKKLIMFEGSVNLDFIVSAFNGFNFYQYKIVLIHCENRARHQRLHLDRNQPELINDQMDTWAEFLKKQAIEKQALILDTTFMNTEEMINQFEKLIDIEKLL